MITEEKDVYVVEIFDRFSGEVTYRSKDHTEEMFAQMEKDQIDISGKINTRQQLTRIVIESVS